MTESDTTPPVKTVKISDVAIRRGQRAYVDMIRNSPALDPVMKALHDQTETQRFRLLVGEVDDMANRLGAGRSLMGDLHIGRDLMPSFSAAALLKGLPEQTFAAAMKNQVAVSSGIADMMKNFSVSSAQNVTASAFSGMKIPSVAEMISADFLKQVGSLQSEAMAIVARQTVTAFRPTIIRPSRTPVRQRVDVRRFLRQLGPEALPALDGIYEVQGLSHGINQSAFSATELLKLVVFTLVSPEQVNEYVRKRQVKREKRHVMELIAATYSLDAQIVMSLSHNGLLADELQDIKHHRYTLSPSDAQRRLDSLIEEMENLIVFLAQSISH